MKDREGCFYSEKTKVFIAYWNEIHTPVCVSQVALELQAGDRAQVTLDVLSLTELQRLGVPHTDDSLKYDYRLAKGRYGMFHLHR